MTEVTATRGDATDVDTAGDPNDTETVDVLGGGDQLESAALPAPEEPVKFDSTHHTTKAGVVEFDYSGAPGHTLQFRTLNYQGFPLQSSGSPRTGKVTLKAGTYQIYCTVAGHAPRGMVATITVNP